MPKVKIGNIELESNVVIAPMAGVTDPAFRYMQKKYSPKVGMVVTEMVNARAIYYDDQKTWKMLKTYKGEYPIVFQLFGDDPQMMGFAAKKISPYCDILDINMGCPAKKIVKSGGGSELLKDLPKAQEVIKQVVANSKVPVTLKTRLGWDDENITCIELAKIAQKEGVCAITVHGRTKVQEYKGNATYDYIKKVKEQVSIPVFANGDITTPKKAKEVLDYTKCDGVAIARASLGNFEIAKRIYEYLENPEEYEKNHKDEIDKEIIYKPFEYIKNMLLEHYDAMLANGLSDTQATKEIRKFVIWNTAQIQDAHIRKNIRVNVSKIVSKESLITLLDANRY